MRKLLITVISLTGIALQAQPAFRVQTQYPIDINGSRVGQPLTGGWNSPQFQSLDINQDGRSDMLVFDRYDSHLETWIRNKDGQLVWDMRYASYFPPGFYFYKLADLNSDSQLDIFTLSESGDLFIYLNKTQEIDSVPHFEMRLNTYGEPGPQFYRNQYDSTFFILHNVLSFSNTDMPDIVDIDGDGDLDIVKYDPWNLTYTEFRDVRAEKNWSSDTFEFQVMDVCFGYFNEGFDNSVLLGECPYQNKLTPRHAGGSSCFLYDKDGDGDMEMVISNIGFKRFTYLENGRIDFGNYYDTMIAVDTLFPFKTGEDFHEYIFPAGYLADADGDGVRDLLIAPNGSADVKETQQVSFYKGALQGKETTWSLQTHDFLASERLDLGARSAPCSIDADGDGDWDVVVASNGDFSKTQGQADRLYLFENLGAPDYALKLVDTDYLNLSDSSWSEMIPCTGDLDNDGDRDMLIGLGNGQVHWLKNDAPVGQSPDFVYSGLPLGAYPTGFEAVNAAPCMHDFSGDGKTDILVGYYNGQISAFEQGNAESFTRVSQSAWGIRANEWKVDREPAGYLSYGYAVPRVADLNLDGQEELILGTAQGLIFRYSIEGHAITDSLLPNNQWLYETAFGGDSAVPNFGFRVVCETVDLDADSIPELIIGNGRGGFALAKSNQGRQISSTQLLSKPLDVRVFPNPHSGVFHVERQDALGRLSLEVVDYTGRRVWTGNMASGERSLLIQMKNVKAGAYYLKATNGQSQVSWPIIMIQP
jgi:hypothetical protein